MKTINVTFTDKEYESLVKMKADTGLNWHDFLIRYAFYKGFYDQAYEETQQRVQKVDEEKDTK